MSSFITRCRWMHFGARAVLGVILFLEAGPACVHAQDSARKSALLNGLKGPPKLEAPTTDAPEKASDSWDKSVLFGFNYTEGNSNTTSLNLNTKVSRDQDDRSWRFEGDYNYANAASEQGESRARTKDNLRLNGEYKHIVSSRLFAGLGSSYTYDSIANVDYRAIVSPSVGTFLYRQNRSSVSVEGGPSYVWERLGGIEDDFPAFRLANRAVARLTETSAFYQSGEFLMSLTDSSNYLFNAEVGIEAAVVSNVSLSFSIRDYYINQPAGGRQSNDIYTITALKLMF